MSEMEMEGNACADTPELDKVFERALAGGVSPGNFGPSKALRLVEAKLRAVRERGFTYKQISQMLIEAGFRCSPKTLQQFFYRERKRSARAESALAPSKAAATPAGRPARTPAAKLMTDKPLRRRALVAEQLPASSVVLQAPPRPSPVQSTPTPKLAPVPPGRTAEVRSVDVVGSDEWGGAPTRRPFEWLVDAVRAQGLHKRYYQMRDGRPGKEGSTVTAFVPWPADIDNGTIASWQEYEAAIRAKR